MGRRINPDLCASGSICGNTDDAGEIEAKCETMGISGGEERYAIAELGTAGGASFEEVVNDGMEALETGITYIQMYS